MKRRIASPIERSMKSAADRIALPEIIEAAPAAPAQQDKKCKCVYATAKNTASVRKGFEMGGYVKEFCDMCKAKDAAPLPQGEQCPSVPRKPTQDDWGAIQAAVDQDCALSIAMQLADGRATTDEAINRIVAYAEAAFAQAAAPAAPAQDAPTRETERALLVAEVGDCCGGGDPMCGGGCLVMKALDKRAIAAPAQQAPEGADSLDANRYRALRKSSPLHYFAFRNFENGFRGGFQQVSDKELDRYIDAAIAAMEAK